jgi:hypothetical protein
MNNKSLVGFFVFSVIIIMIILNPTINAKPSIMVTNYEFYPNDFMSGDKGILKLTIQNTETQASTTETIGDISNSITITENNGVVIKRIWINPAYDENGNKVESKINKGYENIGNIAPGTSFQVSFEIITNENISEGYYFPYVKIDLKNDINGNYEDVTFPIQLRVNNDKLDLLSKNVPSKMSIGGSTDITLSVVNKRKNSVDSVSIYPDENNDLYIYSESKFIGTLNPGESEDIIFSLNPIEMGKKILSLNLSYMNGINQHYERYDIPIEVIEALDVAPIFTDLPLTIKKDKSARIGLEVYNAKTESITGVIIDPITNATVIPSQYFIGAMDPDDVFSASFDIYPDTLDYGDHTIKFKVLFKQGSEYYETSSVSHSFKVVSSEGTSYQSSSNDKSGQSSALDGDILGICIFIIPIIIIIIIAFFIFKLKKGRKNNEK